MIRRSLYLLPTLQDVAMRLTNAKVFKVLDGKRGFWLIRHDESQSPDHFQHTILAFRWLRVPFSINSATEIWPCRAQKPVEGLQGVELIMGNFLVLGFGDILEEAVENQQEKGP